MDRRYNGRRGGVIIMKENWWKIELVVFAIIVLILIICFI